MLRPYSTNFSANFQYQLGLTRRDRHAPASALLDGDLRLYSHLDMCHFIRSGPKELMILDRDTDCTSTDFTSTYRLYSALECCIPSLDLDKDTDCRTDFTSTYRLYSALECSIPSLDLDKDTDCTSTDFTSTYHRLYFLI